MMKKTGKYILTYAADYRGMHAEAQRIVRVVDTVCPEIILAPDTGGTLLPGTPYQEAGYRPSTIMTATSPTGWFGRRNTERSFTR